MNNIHVKEKIKLSTENLKTQVETRMNVERESCKFEKQALEIRKVFNGMPVYDSEDIFVLSTFLKRHSLSVDAARATRMQMEKKGFAPRYWQSTISWFSKYLESHPPAAASPSISTTTLSPEGCRCGDIRIGSTGDEYVYLSNTHKRWFDIHFESFGDKTGDRRYDPRKTDYAFVRKDRYEKILKKLGITDQINL